MGGRGKSPEREQDKTRQGKTIIPAVLLCASRPVPRREGNLAAFTGLNKGRKDRVRLAGRQAGRIAASLQVRIAARPSPPGTPSARLLA